MSRTSLTTGANPNANDNVGKPLGFGNVLFSSEKAMAPVIALPVKRIAQEPAALAA